MKTSTTLSLALGSVLFVASAASAAPIPTTVFSDTFGGSSTAALNGTTASGLTWKAPAINDNGTPGDTADDTGFFADGSIVTPGARGAYVAYEPLAGKIYTLTAVMTTTSGGNEWNAVGWTAQNFAGTSTPATHGNAGYAWTLLRGTERGSSFAGPGATTPSGGNFWADLGHGAAAQYTLEIILDTTISSSVTYSMSFNGTPDVTETIVGDLSALGITGFGISSNNVTGSIDSLTLTSVVPEPSSFALMAGLGALFLAARRKARAS